jgi:hypothetical protein
MRVPLEHRAGCNQTSGLSGIRRPDLRHGQ